MYTLVPSKIFLEQVSVLSSKTKQILADKLRLVKKNPFRYKRIQGYGLLLFRIRCKDNKKELRVVYCVEGTIVKIVCILDRAHEYKDLKKYLKKSR